MNGLEKLKAAILKFMSLGAAPAVVTKPPEGLTVPEPEKIIREVHEALEAAPGHKVKIMPLGKITIEPCTCKHCQMKAKARWN